MAAKKIVTIVGATGAQGKGVVAGFIDDPAYQVRAITRNPASEAGKALAAQGAEVVAADLNDVASIKAAFAGSHIIYGVTNFFEPFIAHQSPVKAVEVEVQQGLNLAAAAAATPTLEHYIWSTLPNVQAITAGKYSVPHFDGKNAVDAHIRADPALRAKATFLWVTWYHSNYVFPMFTPYWIPTAGKHIQFANYAPDTPITTIGDVTANVGAFVRAIVEHPAETQGARTVIAAQSTVGAEDLLQLWARTKGTKAQFVRVGGEAFREIWPLWAAEMGVMMEFWDEYRERSWTIEGETVVTGEDLGVVGLKGLEESFKEFEL
ncbi:hypothetical protein B0H67DRAFT_477044 [Lasiosphaeris hirsuta]|uniref:NmrA-like domain-containing protein n=1 Tax=Lasiosphaeris hirsuta TaxID=260670 RepID=A0AA40BDE2_9PEZI|nr:hypothetical protein B0H67DRAFT_477044 [Lasiosphaeris hirsuta]